MASGFEAEDPIQGCILRLKCRVLLDFRPGLIRKPPLSAFHEILNPVSAAWLRSWPGLEKV